MKHGTHDHTPPTFLTLAGLAHATKRKDGEAINTIVKPFDGCPAALVMLTTAMTQAILSLEHYVQGSALIIHTPDSLADELAPLEVTLAQQCIDTSRESSPSHGAGLLIAALEACADDDARDELASGMVIILGRTLHGMMHAVPGSAG